MPTRIRWKELKAADIATSKQRPRRMPGSYLVYRLTHRTGKSYVGLTRRELWWRVGRHYRNPESVIGRALRRHGLEEFDVRVLASNLTLEQACRLEIHFIKKFNTLTPCGYNVAEGGQVNTTFSSEQRRLYNYKRKLTWGDVARIRVLGRRVRMSVIARKFGVSRHQVNKILQNKRWYDSNYIPFYIRQLDRSGRLVLWQPSLF